MLKRYLSTNSWSLYFLMIDSTCWRINRTHQSKRLYNRDMLLAYNHNNNTKSFLIEVQDTPNQCLATHKKKVYAWHTWDLVETLEKSVRYFGGYFLVFLVFKFCLKVSVYHFLYMRQTPGTALYCGKRAPLPHPQSAQVWPPRQLHRTFQTLSGLQGPGDDSL